MEKIIIFEKNKYESKDIVLLLYTIKLMMIELKKKIFLTNLYTNNIFLEEGYFIRASEDWWNCIMKMYYSLLLEFEFTLDEDRDGDRIGEQRDNPRFIFNCEALKQMNKRLF